MGKTCCTMVISCCGYISAPTTGSARWFARAKATGSKAAAQVRINAAKELKVTMALPLNLRADRELWKHIYVYFPFARSLHLSVLPDYNHVWAEQIWSEDPTLKPELLTTRHWRILRAMERQAHTLGFKVNGKLGKPGTKIQVGIS